MKSKLDCYDESCRNLFCSDGMALADNTAFLPKLSPREFVVLHFLAVGKSNKQIAAELKIEVKTTENQRQSLL